MSTAEAPVVADLEFALDQLDTLGEIDGSDKKVTRQDTKMGAKRCLQ